MSRKIVSTLFVVLLVRSLLGVNTAHSNTPANTSDLNRAGAKPVISAFSAVYYQGGVIVSGTVSDTDNSPVGDIVTLWGSVSGSATVGSNQHFYNSFPNGPMYGEVFAKTTDADGNVSNTAIADIQ